MAWEKSEIKETIQRIRNSQNFEEATRIALEDWKYEIDELKAIHSKYENEKQKVYDSYFQNKCEIKTLSSEWLSSCNKERLFEIAKIFPRFIFENFERFWNEPWAKDILIEISKYDPDIIFIYFQKYKNKPWAKNILIESSKIDPLLAFTLFTYYQDQPWAKDIIEIAKQQKDILIKRFEVNPSFAIIFYDKYKEKPWAKDVIIKACIEEPYFAFVVFSQNKNQDILRAIIKKDVLIKIPKEDPLLAFKYFYEYKDQPWAKDILKAAVEIIRNTGKKDYLKTAYCINMLHNEKDEIRFLIIEWWDENNLYKLIVKWRAEIFTSTYNWIVDRLLNELKKSWKDIFDIAKENNFDWIATFLETATSYWRIKELFYTIKNPENKKILIQKLVESIDFDIVRNSVALMEIIEKVDDKEILNYIWDLIKEWYKRWWASQKTFWIIWKFWSKYLKDNFFKKLPEEYTLPEIKWIPSKELFDKSWRNIQQYFFYNDEDGKSSFDNFVSKYKSDWNWKLEDKKSFIKIISKQKNWKQIVIFANKPEYDWTDKQKNWAKDIWDEINKFNPPLESIVIVHRWHSFHTQKTIDRIPPIAKMVFLWSCWWFQNIWETLKKSPNAHIISTKWTWTKVVNDPLFKLINDSILSWKDIVWENIWWDISKQVWKNSNFEKYVRPDQNIWVLFFNRYNSLE